MPPALGIYGSQANMTLTLAQQLTTTEIVICSGSKLPPEAVLEPLLMYHC
jgi:hypothetical protein